MLSATTILFWGLSLIWISVSTGEKSHYLWIDRIEPNVNKQWMAENYTIQINKVSRNEKHMNVGFTFLKDITDDIVCEMKVFQKMDGKYLKAPADFPKKSCCGFMESNIESWSCIMKFSNLPQKCPIAKGTYEIKEFNANECDIGFMLPPHLPENYKVEFQSFKGPTRIFNMKGYGTIKKKFQIF